MIPIVAEMIRRRPGTISLGQGVVYYGPPAEATSRLTDFLCDRENHRYKSVRGIDPLLEIIQQKLCVENKLALKDTGRIIVTPGSNMAFHNAILTITDPGDEIILLSPYFFNHEMTVTLSDCCPVIVPTDSNHQPDLKAISDAITARTKAVVTVSPNNPTGAVYSKTTLSAINRLCCEHDIYHISDEAYEYFVYDGTEHFSPGSLPAGENHTISLFTLSKAYGFASWRIGYMVVPVHLVAAVEKTQDTLMICPPVASQYAAVGAMEAGLAYCRDKICSINEVRGMFIERLSQLNSFCTVAPSGGGFYLFLKIHDSIDSLKVVERLIEEFGIALIPGSAFGALSDCCLRISYGAVQKQDADEGIDRLVMGLNAIARN
jgi:aspartate/methionine/tyrosine aminotransferase